MNGHRLLIEVTHSDGHNFGTAVFWMELVLYLAEFAMIFFFAHRLFRKKKHSLLAACACAVGGAFLFALIGGIFSYFHQIMGMFFNCGIVIFLILTLQFIYKDKLGFKTAYALLYVSVFTAADFFLMDLLLSLGIGRQPYFHGSDDGIFTLLFCVTRLIIELTAAALVYYVLRRLSADVYRHDPALLNFFALITFGFIQLFGVFSVGITFHTPQLLLAVNALLGLVIMIAVVALLNVFPGFAKLLRRGVPAEKASFDVTAAESSGLSLREMQKLRHDVKNNIATITALIDSGDRSEAKRLLGELGERLGSALGGENKTGVAAIDTAVMQKVKLCEEFSVTLDIHAEPLPETKIPSIDLSSVISNILDNAIEAAHNCDDPVITLRIFKYKSYLAITCENPTAAVPRVVNGKLATTKDGEGHGYGMEIVSEICKNNNGRFQYEFDDKKFKASAFLEL